MDNEVATMTKNLFHPKKGCKALITTGGSESNELMVLTYRNWAYTTKGITKPEIIMALSGHPSIAKGCHYFGVKCVIVPLDSKTLAIDLEAV